MGKGAFIKRMVAVRTNRHYHGTNTIIEKKRKKGGRG